MVAVCQKMTTASAMVPTAMTVSPTAGRNQLAPPSPCCSPPADMSAEPELFEDTFDARGLLVEEGLILIPEQRDHGPVAGLAGLGPLRRHRHLLDQREHRLAL